VFYSVEGIGRGIWALRAEDPLSPRNQDGLIDASEQEFSDLEGQLSLRAHLRRERSRKLVREFKATLSSFACAVCDFDFERFMAISPFVSSKLTTSFRLARSLLRNGRRSPISLGFAPIVIASCT
jgi:hypothetical protein